MIDLPGYTKEGLEVRPPTVLHQRPSILPVPKLIRSHGPRQVAMAPKLEPLQRSITEHMQAARVKSSEKFNNSGLGRKLSERAEASAKGQKAPDAWEKELIAKLEAPASAQR